MKNYLKILYVALCFAVLFFFGMYYITAAPKESTFSESENRKLKGLPEFFPALSAGTLDRETEEYLLDNFPGRSGVIKISHKFSNLMGCASYEEYLKVVKNDKDKLDEDLNDDDVSDIINSLLTQTPSATPTATPSPTPLPTQPVTEAALPTVAISPTPIVSPSPTLSPTPAESPAIVQKPQANIDDYPETLSNYMMVDGVKTILGSYSRNNVLAYTAVLNKYAALLPENGKLITTISLYSTNINQFVNSSQDGYIKCETIDFINAFSSNNVFVVDEGTELTEPIQHGDYIYYRTDAHWTSLGAYYTYCALAKQAGKTPCNYKTDVVRYYEDNFLGNLYRSYPSDALLKQVDTLNVCEPAHICEVRRITGKDTYTVIPFLDWNALESDRYTVNLGGPSGPWIYIDSENDETENCLVITDSTGLSIMPYLACNYKQVHYYDARYYDKDIVGYSVSEMIEKYNITDIYVVIGEYHTFDSGFIIKTTNNAF